MIILIKNVCHNCVSHKSLKNHIKSIGSTNKCCYCHKEDVLTIPSLLLFEYIEKRLNEILTPLNYYNRLESFYYEADEDLTTYTRSYDFFQRLEDSFEPLLFDDLISHFDQFFSNEEPLISLIDSFRYKEDTSSSHTLKWEVYLNKLNHEFRYSNSEFVALIEKIISPIVKNDVLMKKFIKTIPAGKTIYRGRVFSKEKDKTTIIKKPFSELGPPPNILATEQRMTPSGISAFYGALDRETCLSELRPVAGIKIVTGGFLPKFNINLLDLDVLKKTIPDSKHISTDPFAPHLAEEIDSMFFFRDLYAELVKPSTSGDNFTYRLTQLFFEVIRIRFLNQIHGVSFSSVQRGGKGKNIVLFPEYSVTENSIGDVYYPHGLTPMKYFSESLQFPNFKFANYSINPVLTFDNTSMKFHLIKAVKVISESINLVNT